MSKPTFDPSMWLNNVRAVPTVGVRFHLTIDTSSSLVQRLKGMLTKWQSANSIKIGLSADNSVKIERQDGIEVTVGNNRVVCKYYYISEIVEKGNLEPVIKFHAPRKPFEEICIRLQDVLFEVYTEICKDGNRTVEFAGVVAEGNLDPDGLPPGFTKMLEHFGKPWPLGLSELNGRFLAGVQDAPSTTDRCHHMVDFNSNAESVVEFKLDWQRVWKSPRETNPTKLKADMEACRAAAMNYFGKFGLGDLCYGE